MAKEPTVPGPPRAGLQDAADPPLSPVAPVPRIVGDALESRPRHDHAAEAVLDKLNRGVVIFDSDGRVHFVNDAALRLARETQALDLTDGRLTFTAAHAQAGLTGYLTQCRESADGCAEPAAVVMRIVPGVERPPFRVLLSPLRLPSSPLDGHREWRHVLMIFEPNAGMRLPRRILTELYGMSEAEASLVSLLFAGESLEHAAQQLHVSINTAKTHLQHVFVKCQVHSQAELLQLLSLGPRTL